MAEASLAIDYVLLREGGFVDNAADSGGATNFGLSLRFLRSLKSENLRRYGIFESAEELGIGTVHDLTVEQAKLIYKGEFWDEAPFANIESQKLCNYYYDMCVNMGLHQATQLLQRALWTTCAGINHTTLRDDGILGQRTIGYVNECKEELLPILVDMRVGFYKQLVESKPKDREFLNGWLNRCYQV
jgi:lysozyme family protein